MGGAIRRENLSPIPWREFVLGYEVAVAALQHEPDPQEGTDPIMTVIDAAQGHFGDDSTHVKSFLYRFWALMDLVSKGQLAPWVSDDSQQQQLHPALLLAAAEVRMTKKGRFPAKRFVQHVEEIIRTESDEAS